MNHNTELDSHIWKILLADESIESTLHDLLDIGSMIWQRGWAEANAGNVSLRLPESFGQKVLPFFNTLDKEHFLQESGSDTYDWFLVSATGSRYREFDKLGFGNFVIYGANPEHNIILPDNRKPTSEWITHLSVHNWLSEFRPSKKVILHAHPTDWIILSGLPEYNMDGQRLMKYLYDALPELNIYLPEGISCTTIAPPGSELLAAQTISALKQSNAIIWEKHGVVIIAEDITKAFDILEIVSKAAKVYLSLRR